MAGTIIGNISLGASDWSTWITRQERGERGHLQLSLTNFAATTASTVATGSVIECAGSLYTFTDTSISLATGTASAAVSVYFVVIPSAGGTTCTIEMNSVAPTWVDAKQGFYASAASISRVIGGCYIGSSLVYYRKWLYEETALSSLRRYGDGTIEASGKISGTSAVISGTLYAVDIVAVGNISGSAATISGRISGSSAVISGTLYAIDIQTTGGIDAGASGTYLKTKTFTGTTSSADNKVFTHGLIQTKIYGVAAAAWRTSDGAAANLLSHAVGTATIAIYLGTSDNWTVNAVVFYIP